jgi:hypothetical protein
VSLAIFYHDKDRALVVSDDRAIDFDSDGKPVPRPERCPKFIFLPNDVIFAALGPSKASANFRVIADSIVRFNKGVGLADLADALPRIFPGQWAKRTHDPNMPAASNCAETALIGFDNHQKRMRAFQFVSYEGFRAHEVPAGDDCPSVLALGCYGKEDWPRLQQWAREMHIGRTKDLCWIASRSADYIRGFHQQNPIRIGEPSFYGALDRNGRVRLPAEFPPPPEAAVPIPAAQHLVTQTKEVAMDGMTRFFIGSIVTPRQGGADTVGDNDGGAGAQVGSLIILRPIANGTSGTFGNGSVVNPTNCYDGTDTDYTTLSLSGNSGSNAAVLALSGFPAIGNFPVTTVEIDWAVPTNNLNSSSQPVFWIQVGVQGQFGTFVTIPGTSLNAGQTQSRITSSFTLPTGQGLGTVEVLIEAAISTGTTSGTLTAQIFDVRVGCGT